MFELRPYNRNHSGMTYNPFKMMDNFEREFFGEPFTRFFESGSLAEFKTDIRDKGDSYLLEADLPGFDKNDINLELNGDTLQIVAERHSEREHNDKNNDYICSERSYGKYVRSFDVSAVDTDKISAKYTNGVLELLLPKKAEVKPQSRKLEIE